MPLQQWCPRSGVVVEPLFCRCCGSHPSFIGLRILAVAPQSNPTWLGQVWIPNSAVREVVASSGDLDDDEMAASRGPLPGDRRATKRVRD